MLECQEWAHGQPLEYKPLAWCNEAPDASDAEGNQPMLTINLSEQDIMRLKVAVMDQDKDDAYAFLRDRLLPEIQKREGMAMKSHLDGGKGSMF